MGNNWWEVTFVTFSISFDKSDVDWVREHVLDHGFGNRFSALAHDAPKTQALLETLESVAPLGKLLECFTHHFCFHRVRLDIMRLEIVRVADGRKSWPLSAPEFLPDPAFDVFGEVVAVIFRLPERHLQHEQPLRSWLKPECREAQRSNLSNVYGVDDEATVHGVTG
ncbi:hypothetical protein A3J43_01735 [Candidatus Uhrbacteria bacterium RIFCSPHIGHO2_12_FULL_54_23]|uniref:Uncharacterized protein n=1 Tax=Candidatus Uhrbacteria bacterium RIFCSPHIGHO2_12_FULL_54_23 TaxID=1802397 RepID=A0A1F7UIN8_9BACT|nr:MAG: hypothetical protein A3J43_01735 [Candidatus Uhrbacteria bacterium RIFCSPHIGHO2_12_FULL_54_23]